MSEPESAPLSRIELLRLAQSLGVSDADVMTRAELRVAIDSSQRPEPASAEPYPSTWVGVARRLLARVVERGLNLPDAAALIRGDTKLSTPPKAPPPVATVTLARIYAAQGHLARAITTLDEVLESDPDHELARDLRTQLELRRDELLAATPAVTVPAEAERDTEEPPPSLAEPTDVPAPSAPTSHEASSTLEQTPEPVDAAPFAPVVPLAVAPAPERADSAPGELMAPAFDVIERAASNTLAPDDDTSPISERAPADLLGTEPPASAFYTEPPTMVGVRLPLESLTPSAPSAFPDTEPPATIAVGFDASSTLPPGPSLAKPEPVPVPAEPVPAEPAPIAAASSPEHAEPAGAPNGASMNGIHLGTDPSPARPEPSPIAAAPSAEREPPSVANGTAPANEPPAPPLPEAPGLVLIETDSPTRYLYWEVAAAGLNSRFWIHVVTHVAGAHGEAERRERRFPVYRQQGVLRLEGVPARAVVRARLTRDADDTRSVVVAGAVKQQAPGASSVYHASYAPFAAARPELIAERAAALLDRASPVYWD
jgi:hypothetical protein